VNDFPGGLSPFRAGFLRVQLFISGAWVDVPITDLEDDGVTLHRRAGGTGSARFSLRDATGKWSPRHPASPYYGLIGRGTPVRVQVELTAGSVQDRWYGEVVSWQPRWTKTGPKDARVDVECAGAMRRLAQGAAPLATPIYRAIKTIASDDLIGYWPMQDGRNAKAFAVDVGARNMTVSTGGCRPSDYDGFAASQPIPTIQGANLEATVPSYAPLATPQVQVRWLGMIPDTTPNNAVIMRVLATGTLGWAEVRYETGGIIRVEGFNDAGVSVGTGAYSFGLNGLNCRFSLELTQSGGNVAWQFGMLQVGAASASFGGGTFTGVTLTRASFLEINPLKQALGDMAFGHLTVERQQTSLFAVSSLALSGYVGEAANARFLRLCAENGISSALYAVTGSQAMGVQGRADIVTLLRELAETDGGMLYEPRSTTELAYRSLETLYSQTPFTVPYQDNLLLPFEPIEDDGLLRNRVSVTRDGGGTATVTETTGPLGTASVGTYDDGVTLSLADEDAPALQAAWRVHLGTHDEARWPTIGYDLADPRINAGLRATLLGAASLGSRIDVTNLPPWLPPFPVSQLVTGITETITPHAYRIELDCIPARPYRVPTYGDTADRWSGEGTVTAGALTATQTTFSVTPAGGVGWTSVDGPYEIVIGGEVMRVTNVSGGINFTVVRSVNGVRKAHASGATLALADPCYYGL
jgi:hypothetical protein